jgi:osmoprotectant transport system permease protein
VRGVDPGAVSAARAMGFDERELMARVELPLATPVILTGVRIAAVQVIATEPLAAFFGGDGLGVYLRQGLGNQDFLQVQAGALLVTATAIGVDLLLYLAGRAVLPRGVQRSASGRAARRANRPSPIPR